MSRTFVVGVGMTKFERPGSRKWQYPDMGREAGQISWDRFFWCDRTPPMIGVGPIALGKESPCQISLI